MAEIPEEVFLTEVLRDDLTTAVMTGHYMTYNLPFSLLKGEALQFS
jgi:hypothetical protein